MFFDSIFFNYPGVNVDIDVENHGLSWKNDLQMVVFHIYVGLQQGKLTVASNNSNA